MNLLLGSLTIGLILSLLAWGVYISFRIFSFPDMTADGSIVIGAAVAARLLTAGMPPLPATLLGASAGILAGLATGILHTRFKINGLLAGILVMTALYSVNLHIMGRSNLPLLSVRTMMTDVDALAEAASGGRVEFNLGGWPVARQDLAAFIASAAVTALMAGLLLWFFRTRMGSAMRATGDNPQMIRALGGNTDRLMIIGLALSNGVIALSGALLAQYQGFADVQMGLGMLVWGLASVIIGESLMQSRRVAPAIIGAVMGSLLFRLLVAIALRWGLNPNDLKLITAIFVLAALILPKLKSGNMRALKLKT